MVVATVLEVVVVWKFSLEVELDSLEEVVAVELVPLEEEKVLDHVEGLEISVGGWVMMDLGLLEGEVERSKEEEVFPSSPAPSPCSRDECHPTLVVSSLNVVELVPAPRQRP